MKELGSLWLLVLLIGTASCGSASRGKQRVAGAGGEGSGGEAGVGGTIPGLIRPDGTCTDGIQAYRGVRYDPDLKCLDTEDIALVGCRGTQHLSGYWCVRRRSDGEEFWATTGDELVFDSSDWEACPADVIPPPPCFAVQCEKAPRSLCFESDTRAQFDCGGPSSEWDENCCARPECIQPSDCASGESCAEIVTRASWDCWPVAGAATCDCGGTPGGPSRFACVE